MQAKMKTSHIDTQEPDHKLHQRNQHPWPQWRDSPEQLSTAKFLRANN